MNKLFNFRPILFICLATALGVVTAVCFFNGKLWLGVLLPIIFLGVSITATIIYKGENKEFIKRNLITLSLVIIFFLSTFSFTFIKTKNYQKADLNYHTYTVSGKVISAGGENNQQLTVSKVKLVSNGDKKLRYKINVYVYGGGSFSVGDYITFTAKLNDYGVIYNEEYSARNIDNGVKYYANVSAQDIVIDYHDKTIFESINSRIKYAMENGLSGQEFGVAFALITGNSDFIDRELLSNFRYAGIAHIFAVSGLHVGILATVLTFILKKLKANKYLSYAIIAGVCFMYSGVCGFSSSSLRATIMCAVLNLSTILGKKYDPISSISLSAVLLLLVKPLQLFNVGFQLSFTVVYGILLLSKPITDFILKLIKITPKKLANALGVVLSAQIASLPICLSVFGYASILSVLFNLIFLPLISAFYVFLFASVIIAMIIGLEFYILFPSNLILKGVIFIVDLIDYSKFLLGGLAIGWFAISYYAVIVLASGIVNIKKLVNLITCIVLSVTFLSGSIAYTALGNRQDRVYLYADEQTTLTLIKRQDNNLLVISKLEHYYSLKGIKNIVSYANINHLSALVIIDGDGVDAQEFYTLFRKIIQTDNLFIRAGYDNVGAPAFIASFPSVALYYYDNDDRLEIKGYSVNGICKGNGLTVSYNDKNLLLLSHVNTLTEDLVNLSKNYNLFYVENMPDILFKIVNAENMASSEYCVGYPSPLRLGIISYKL